MLKVGLTGGIGSGKSVIAKIFACMQVPIYNSDIRAKELMIEDFELRNKITQLFGENSYKNNELQRDVLAQAIFNNSELRLQLNAIVHPRVRQDFLDWAKMQQAQYVIMESALLFETDLYTMFDYTIFVASELQLRIDRVMLRDRCLETDVIKRIKMQPNDEFCIQKSHFVVENNNTFVIPQVIEIDKRLKNFLNGKIR